MDVQEVKRFLETLTQDAISFDPHFYKRSAERPINEGIVRRFLPNIKKLEKIEHGKEGSNRFKLWYNMSNKYSLVVIAEIELPKVLKVISAWNTQRKWQAKLQR